MGYTVGGMIADALKQQGMKQKQFATDIDLSESFLSRVLKGDKLIPLPSLDKAISVLGLDVDEYYSLYLSECWTSKTRAAKLVEKYILHCLGEELADHATKALEMLLERGGMLGSVFTIGDKLFQQESKMLALPYFQAVINHETDKKSTYLALSYYRKLMTFYHNDTDKSVECAYHLCELLDYIPDDEVLEAYYRVIGTFRLKENWEYVLHYGEKLRKLAKLMQRQDYLGDVLIKMAIAAREIKDYSAALSFHDEGMTIEVGNYSKWAYGNRLITLITAGEKDYITDLLEFCAEHKDLSFEYLEFLLDSVVKNEMYDLVRVIFNKFPEEIKYLEGKWDERSIYARHLINFTFAKATYQLKNGDTHGIEEALKVAEMSRKLKLRKQTIQSCKLIFIHAEKNSDAYQRGLEIIEEIS